MSLGAGLIGRIGAGARAARGSRLLLSGAGIGGLTAAELALGLVTAILLARELGAAGLGAYALALAVAVLGGLLVELGLPSLVIREIAHAGESVAGAVAKAVMIFAAAVIAVMTAVILPLTLALGGTIASGLGENGGPILPVAVLLIPVTAVANTFGGALAGAHRVVAGNLPQKLVRPGAFALALGLSLLIAPGWLTPARAMALQLGAATAALVVAAALCLRHFAAALAAPSGAILWRSWGPAMLRLGLINGLRLAEAQILLLLTGALATVEAAGLLRIAQRGAALASLGVSIAVIVAAPEIARLDSAGEHDRLQRLLTQAARASAAAAAGGLLVFVVAGHWLLAAFFGPEFVAAWAALVILAGAEVVRAVLGPGAVLLSMLRHEAVTALGLALSVGVSAAVAVALLPVHGVEGAAWGGLAGLAAASALLCWRSRRILALDPTALGGRVAGGARPASRGAGRGP